MTEERKEKNRIAQLKWRMSHKEEKRKLNRLWRETHPDYDREYQRTHEEQIKSRRRKRRLLNKVLQ